MSAANAPLPSVPQQEQLRAPEPSMEEILASIRRIIADDEVLPAVRREDRRLPQAESPAPQADSQIERRDERAPEPAVASAEIRPLRLPTREPATAPDIGFALDAAATEAEAADDEAFDDADDDSRDQDANASEAPAPLMSADAASSIASHFEALAASMFMNDKGILRDYAQDMMRPMLKQWLDDNLPVIVERLVRAEIERVARGGRR